MKLRAFTERLVRAERLALDVGPFQVYVQGLSRYEALSMALFAHVERGRSTAVTSALTLAELLVPPYRDQDDALVQEFNVLWPTFPHLEMVPVSLAIADRAAALRARHGLDWLTSVQAATALEAGATLYVTTAAASKVLHNDMDVLVLDEYL